MGKKHFAQVSAKVSFPEIEDRVISYWKKHKTFEKSVESRSKDKTWTFLDGPPFITGLPHYGSLLSSIPKDVFPRFWTMQGYRVRRVWGWDCHGLPAENKVENELGIKRKKDIEEKVGIKKFIDACKRYVSDVSEEWEWYVDHVGRWVDFKNAYKTMDTSYMESVMWVFRQMYDKEYIYKGLRVSLYCPHCSTPISNFEVAMDADNYKKITEAATTYKYEVKGEKNTYFLAWSTTPWNKIATPALAVNPKLTYVKVKQGDAHYILAKDRLEHLDEKPKAKIVKTFKGKALVGMEFVPHYDFYEVEKDKRAFVIIPGDFVTADEGTGIVTIAAYGEDDLRVMQEHDIQVVLHVDEEGILIDSVPKWGGMYYLKVNPLVNEDLASRGLVYRDEQLTHTVPTCWRCHTRLIFAPQDAWYVDVQKLKPMLKKTNKAVNWFPQHFKFGRYAKSVEAAPDWCISRSRYWGSPVPVWECDCGERFVPGSMDELETLSGTVIKDLHKPEIDDVTIPCTKCDGTARRVPEVLDSWIEAGSASFAERHYPFEKGVDLKDFFPPDFIVEYTGQIRAWFYVLHVIATALYGTHAFKNVVTTGVILGTDGRKMSKNYGNYPDPKLMLTKHGGDALRLYLMGSPVMHGEDIRISEEEYRNQVKGILLLLWNSYNFFVTYANMHAWAPKKKQSFSNHVMDRWVVSKLNANIKDMEKAYRAYDTPAVVSLVWEFMRLLSQWYVRRIRDRVNPSSNDAADTHAALSTLWYVLTRYTRASAPLIPFITEEIYRNLTGEESVHLTDWPKVDSKRIDAALEKEMQHAMELTTAVHALRKANSIKVRMPIRSLDYQGPAKLSHEVRAVVQEETNVYELVYKKKADTYTVAGSTSGDNLDHMAGRARELVRSIQILRKNKQCTIDARIHLVLPSEYKDLEKKHLAYVQEKTLTESITWGTELSLSIG